MGRTSLSITDIAENLRDGARFYEWQRSGEIFSLRECGKDEFELLKGGIPFPGIKCFLCPRSILRIDVTGPHADYMHLYYSEIRFV